jgi:hypothetical protein
LFSALFYFLFRVSFSVLLPLNLVAVPVGLAWGSILGMIAFSIFPAMDQQISAFVMFLPIRMRGRTFLIIIILFRLLPILSNPFNALFTLPDLGGIVGAYILYKLNFKSL